MKEILQDLGFAVALSGAGPTLLAISDKEGMLKLIPTTVDGVKWRVLPLKVCDKGAVLK